MSRGKRPPEKIDWRALEAQARREAQRNKRLVDAGETFAGTPQPYQRKPRRGHEDGPHQHR